MATKTPPRKAASASKKRPAGVSLTRIAAIPVGWWNGLVRRRNNLLARRPHRSFRRTRRRDYVRSLEMPGYWSFIIEVWRKIWMHRRLFGALLVVYTFLSILLVGITSQDTYTALSQELRSSGTEVFNGEWTEFNQVSMLLLTGAAGSLSSSPTQVQQVYALILIILVWLTTVWLLRAINAGRKPRLRDGLYNAGSPIISTALVMLIGLLQLLPVTLAVLGFSAANAAGLLTGGVESMVFWVCLTALSVLSLYWLTSTFIAMVVVTLPGMYPLQALRTAGDLVIGRRLRILLRLLWLAVHLCVIWVLVMVPSILLDTWIKGMVPSMEWIPFVPVVLVVISSFTVLAAAAYVYLLYRKVVDDEAGPA